jgi:predicted DNA-binding protein
VCTVLEEAVHRGITEMDSNIIKFRLTPEVLQLLESVKDGDESLHQTAKRILESSLKVSTQVGHSKDTAVHNTFVESTQLGHSSTQDVSEVVQQKIEELESDLYTRLSDQLNGLLDTRLGEFQA